MDVVIRPEHADDVDAIDALVAAAFGSPAEAQLVHRIRSSDLYWPELALVATVDGEVVGHVMISGAGLTTSEGQSTVAVLSPLAVAPQHHGQGIGGALVRKVCARADERGEPMVLLQGDPRYYRRFGFEPSADHGIAMELPDWTPPEAAQILRLTAWTNRLTGERTVPFGPGQNGTVGELVLPAAFDDLD